MAFLMPAAKDEWRRIATGLYHMGLADAGRRESARRVLPSVRALGHRGSITCAPGRARSAQQRLDDQDHGRQRDSKPAGRDRQQSGQRHGQYATEFGFTLPPVSALPRGLPTAVPSRSSPASSAASAEVKRTRWQGQLGGGYQQQSSGGVTGSSLFVPGAQFGNWWPADLGIPGLSTPA